MEKQIFTEAQEKRIKELLTESLKCFFEKKGKGAKNLLIGAAIVIGSLTVILGGFKAILGWIGFVIVK